MRFFGVQELASTVFSLLNALPHIIALTVWRHKLMPRNYYYTPFIQWLACVAIGTWAFSTLFHARDTPLTERLDYHGTTTLIVTQLFVGLVRFFRIRDEASATVLGALLYLSLAAHILHMNLVLFDYGWNMFVSVCAVLGYATGWVVWAIQHWKRPYAWKAPFLAFCLIAAGTLEIFDFAPIYGLFDAHSIWHLATVPIGFAWYKFLEEDTHFEMRFDRRKVVARGGLDKIL